MKHMFSNRGRAGKPGALGLLAVVALAASVVAPAPLRVVVVLAAVVGAVYLCRRQALASKGRVPSTLERLDACPLGSGLSVQTVRYGERVLLLGVTPSSITLLVVGEAPRPRPVTSVAAQRPTAAGRRVLFTALALLALCSPVLATDPRDSTVQRAGSASVAIPPPADETSVPALPGRADEQVGPAMVWIVLFSLTPVIVVCATAYLKISVVLSLLRNALATPQVPSDTVIAGISLALAIFVMGPVVRDARQQVARCGADLNTASGALAAVTAAAVPLRAFLQRNSRPSDIELFASFAGAASEPEPDTVDVLLPAFVVGQLREGFVCGFLLFLPFLVVDLVVANILMSLGMVMVSPSSIALPFKLMLFAMIDGWSLLAQGLALSFK